MTVKELIVLLSTLDGSLDVHVETPDKSDDFFVDGVRGDGRNHQAFIETS